jgi:hypothetical protein
VEKLTFPELTVHLSSQDVEQIRRRSHAGDLHVAILVLTVQPVLAWEDSRFLIAKLEPSLHPSGRVFRTLSVIPVREGHNQAGPLKPFDLTGCNELIDDTLRIVGEVTELSLPHHQSVR